MVEHAQMCECVGASKDVIGTSHCCHRMSAAVSPAAPAQRPPD